METRREALKMAGIPVGFAVIAEQAFREGNGKPYILAVELYDVEAFSDCRLHVIAGISQPTEPGMYRVKDNTGSHYFLLTMRRLWKIIDPQMGEKMYDTSWDKIEALLVEGVTLEKF